MITKNSFFSIFVFSERSVKLHWVKVINRYPYRAEVSNHAAISFEKNTSLHTSVTSKMKLGKIKKGDVRDG